MGRKIVVNTRVLQAQLTGVQRYTNELINRFKDQVKTINPKQHLSGTWGHAWEQFILPGMTCNNLLFSPANVGPLAVKNQVVTIHDLAPLDHPEWNNSRYSAWYQFLLPRLARRVRHVIVDSEFTKKRLIEQSGVSSEKISVIYCGVDRQFTLQNIQNNHEAVEELQLPSSRYVLTVGSLEPRKNLGRLLLAWQNLLPSLPRDLWLILTGVKGKSLIFADVPELRNLPPRVFLTGYVPDELLPTLYANAQVFVYPSVYEGFGLPPLEAMAAGAPVLTGKLASLPEVVGEAGLMIDPYDVDDIASSLARLIKNDGLRAKLREAGMERAAAFNWKITAEKTFSLLQRIAEGA